MKNTKRRTRFLNRNTGRFNVTRKGRRSSFDFYHTILSMKWGPFMGFAISVYMGLNFIFAFALYSCGPEGLRGLSGAESPGRFWETFFFSVHTLATIGYGSISPASTLAHILVTGEAFVGLMSVALLTGLLFARFSKPTARIIFSDVALVSLRQGVPTFMFRLANERLNQVAHAEIDVTLMVNEVTQEGERLRVAKDLKLVRNRSSFFALSWTILHVIDDESPLRGLKTEDLEKMQAEIFVTFTGIDDVLTQTVHARSSYTAENLIWGKRFRDIMLRDDLGNLQIDLDSIHEVV